MQDSACGKFLDMPHRVSIRCVRDRLRHRGRVRTKQAILIYINNTRIKLNQKEVVP